MSESMKPLLDLQEVDHNRDRLLERRERLPERSQAADLERRMQEIRGAIDQVDRRVQDLGRDITHREGELGLIVDKIAGEEKKLYSGAVQNPKELSALQAEIKMLRNRKAPMEEEIFERLMARDELTEERGRLEAELADLDREAQEVAGRIRAAEQEIDAHLAVEDERRAEILPQLPSDVIALYEELREQKRGTGAGALQDGACTACREALSAVVVDRIKQAVKAGESRFRCEHCRRILVVQ